MIMPVTDFTQYMKQLFPAIKFYTGAINRNESECVGIFLKNASPSPIALGGVQNTSSNILPLRILVHWTENSATCEGIANSIYDELFGQSNFYINGRRIISINMLDSSPIDIDRDERGVAEMVIRLNIVYEREVM